MYKLLLVVFIAFISISLEAQTNVAGNVSGTWTKANSPYILTNNITVPTGQTLVIESGVTVQFRKSNLNLFVNGSLKAQGKATDSVRFIGRTDPASPITPSTHAGAVYFNAGSDSSTLNFVSIDSLGDVSFGGNAINIVSNISIKNSLIKNGEDNGIYISGTSKPVITDCRFSGNKGLDVSAILGNVQNLVGNTNVVIGLRTGTSSVSTILPKAGNNSSYKLLGDVTINSSGSLLIHSGVSIIFPSSNTDLFVSGKLTAVGTLTDSIRFIGRANPLVSGSTHGGTIYFNAGSDSSLLQFVSIDSLGDAANGGIGIYTASGCSIKNTLIKNSEGTALYLAGTGVPAITNCIFSGNKSMDISAGLSNAQKIANITNTIINLRAGTYNENITLSKPGTGSYYKINGDIIVGSTAKFTVQPGVTIVFPSYNYDLTINGKMTAVGNISDSIKFIGKADPLISISSHGGTLNLSGVDSSLLQYVSIDSLGDTGNGGIAVSVSSSSIIKNSTIRNSEGTGIYISGVATPAISNCLLYSNKTTDISASIDNVQRITDNKGIVINLRSSTSIGNTVLPRQGIGSFFEIPGTITISSGLSLQIQPGVTVAFTNYNAKLNINGKLFATGTPTDSIKLSGKNGFGGTITLGTNDSSVLQYVAIDSMGAIAGGGTAIFLSGNATIKNSAIRNSERNAISTALTTIRPFIHDCDFGNRGYITGYLNTYINAYNNKNVTLKFQEGSLTSNYTLRYPGSNSYYQFQSSNFSIPSNTTLTVEPGVLLDFNSNTASILVSGSLRSLGTENAPVQFTRLDTIGGLYGGGITLTTNSNSTINNTIFTRLGYSNAALRIQNNATVLTDRITVNDNTNSGISITASSPFINASSITNNTIGVSVFSGKPIFVNCNITGNKTSGITNTSTTDTVDARNCWWGHSTGPLHTTTNPGGLGNSVSNRVLYNPWLSKATGNQVNDIGIAAILSPASNCNLTTTEQVKIKITNYGNTQQTGFTVGYRIDNSIAFTENVGGFALPAGASKEYTFLTRASLATPNSTYNLKAFTSLAGDSLRNNDTASLSVQHYASLLSPGNLIPLNNATDIALPLTFSWSAVANAITYDLFIWPSAGTMPTTPTKSGIQQINYTHTTALVYGASYKWKVRAVRNSCTTESIVQQFTVRNLPDLAVTEITAPPTAVSETNISFSWKVKNQGTGATNTEWWEAAYLSDDTQLNTGNDLLIGSYTNISALNPAQLYQSLNQTYKIPQGLQGTYYLIIVTDYSKKVGETIETNNSLTSTAINITLAPPPDLQVTALAVNPVNAFSEDTLTINWTVKNNGAGPTTITQWNDAVYLSTSPVYSTTGNTLLSNLVHNGSVAANGSYNQSIKIKLPVNLQGTYYVHVFTDINSKVFEYTEEDNNTASSNPLTIFLKPSANLTVDAINVAVDTLSAGQSVNVQWTTGNSGSSPITKKWTDRVYLSADNSFNVNSDIALGSFDQTGVLQSLSSTSTQLPVTLPASLAEGNYYFFVRSDVSNTINEFPNEDDNVSSAAGPVFIALPDFAPPVISTPATAVSEQVVTVNYTVKNIGKGNLLSGTWKDGIYLSADNTFGTGDVLLGSITNNSILFRNNSYSAQANVTLPTGISGNYYLLVVTDMGGTINESNQANNIASSAISISLAAWPDLRVSTLSPALNDTAGRPIVISYTARNAGTGNIVSKQWRDNFYLSPTNTLTDPANILLGYIAQSRSLNSLETYSGQATFTIPASVLPGIYYIVATTDATNTVFENTAESNNSFLSSAITITALPNIDLVVTGGNTSSGSILAGQSIQANYTIRNASTTATLPGGWTDAIYLSNNTVIDAGDRLLGSWEVGTALAPNGSVAQSRTITIPNDASGSLYLIVLVDQNNTQNDINRGNNFLALNTTGSGGQPIVITQPTPADLQPVSLIAPAEATEGQPVMIKYTIRNNGPGATFASLWTDYAFVATDVNSTTPSYPVYKNGRAPLAANASYTDSMQLFVSKGYTGNYVVVLHTDYTNKQYEMNGETNNRISVPIVVNPQDPCDLLVNSIALPSGSQIAGQNTTIQWQLYNSGLNAAKGYFKEAVYLSIDTSFDANTDILIGTLENYISLQPKQTLARQLTAPLNNVTTGQFYIIIRTDIQDNLLELDEENNQLVSESVITVDVKNLALASPANDTLYNGRGLYYRIVIADNLRNETMRLKLTADTAKKAVNRLFLRYGQVPSANTYDFAAEIPFSTNQEITVPELKPGTYYLLALGNDTSLLKKQLVTLDARIIPFGISSVASDKGGNTGLVTLKIKGAKFDRSTTFKLRNATKGNITHYQTYYVDQTEVYVTYDLTNKPIGVYDVVATKGTDSTALLNGFEIIKGTGSTEITGGTGSGSGFTCEITNIGFENNLETDILAPPNARFGTLINITVYFENKGNVDIPVQTRFFNALTKSTWVSFVPADLTKKLTDLILECKEQNGPPGILRPGASGFFKIYSKCELRGGIPTLDYIITE